MAANLGRLESKVDGIATELKGLSVSVATMMPRGEVDSELARRVSMEMYAADQRATNERLMRLEASPTRMLAWISGAVGCLGVLIAGASLTFSVVVYVLMHH